MGSINVFGLLIVLLGFFSIWLGITGKYVVFTGVPTNNLESAAQQKADQEAAQAGLENNLGPAGSDEAAKIVQEPSFWQGFWQNFL